MKGKFSEEARGSKGRKSWFLIFLLSGIILPGMFSGCKLAAPSNAEDSQSSRKKYPPSGDDEGFGLDLGRRKDVFLSAASFDPDIQANIAWMYQGRLGSLTTCDNEAENTTRYYYFSKDGNFRYGEKDQLLADFFYYCFLKSLKRTGMKLYESHDFNVWVPFLTSRPPQGVPWVYLTLLAIDDQNMKVKVKAIIDQAPEYEREFSVAREAPSTMEQENPDLLQLRAYSMVHTLACEMLKDPNFQKLFPQEEGK